MTTGSRRAMFTAAVPAADRARLCGLAFAGRACAERSEPAAPGPAAALALRLELLSRP